MGGSCKRITGTRCLCVLPRQVQVRLTGVSSQKNVPEFMFLKIVHLILLEAVVFPGAGSYSHKNLIITTARACSTAYVIIEG